MIGMSCRFADSDNVREFWSHLCQGRELIHFFTEEELNDMNISPSVTAQAGFVKARSVVKEKTMFDYSFFGYTREEAHLMDPQIRIFHEEVWHALEDAGYDPYQYEGRTGLFAGASGHLNWMAHAMLRRMDSDVDPFFANIVSDKSFLPTLVAYKLNLKGPAYFVNTACSTSLATIHLACRSLLMQECNMAVAGAVRIDVSTAVGYQYQPGMIYAADGHCRTFDAAASGTISGEGAGVVVLKRLEDALRDQDHIYAVIKGTAVNNDGNRKVGYTAPSPEGQAECIRMAHRFAGVAPETISYLEAHGTATQLGDPVEIAALNEAFNFNKNKHCAVGAVKSNMGHLDTAAGVAGFIKTVLSLYHRELPASLHFQHANPVIDFDNGPFYVNHTHRPWPTSGDHPRRAGVSAFGIGGTNVHVVLEENPQQEAVTVAAAGQLLVCSAKTPEALERNLEALQQLLADNTFRLTDIARTLQQGRHHFRYRAAFAGNDRVALQEQVRNYKGTKIPAGKSPEIIFMFSGQGAQYVNMGVGLYREEPVFRKWADEGCRLLEAITGERYIDLLYPAATAAADELHHTRYTQPVLFVFEYALAQLLMHWGIRPAKMIGHSVGEITAACVSGVFSFEDGIRIIAGRARLMSEQPVGAMLGVSAAATAIAPFLSGELNIAAVNAPGYCVVSGPENSIVALQAILQQQQISSTRLKTSHAFHSSMMEPAVDAFVTLMRTIRLSPPQIPIASNVSGTVAGEEMTTAEYWGRHIRETVHFESGIQTLSQTTQDVIWIEVGPGNTLSNFCRHLQQQQPSQHTVVSLVRHPQDNTPDNIFLLNALGRIWEKGGTPDWRHFGAAAEGRRVPLPGYAFERNDLPAVTDLEQLLTQYTSLHKAPQRSLTDSFYLPGLKRAAALPSKAEGPPLRLLLFSDGSLLADKLKSRLTAAGHEIIEVLKSTYDDQPQEKVYIVNPDGITGFERLSAGLHQQAFDPHQVIYMWELAPHPEDAARIQAAFFHLLQLLQVLPVSQQAAQKKITFVTNRSLPVLDEPHGGNTAAAPALGLLKVISQEYPFLICTHLDIAMEEEADTLTESIGRELLYNTIQPFVALRRGTRWVRDYEQLTASAFSEAQVLRQGAVYLITGGLGKAALILAAYLLETYAARVILVGRSHLTPEKDAVRQEQLRYLEGLPGQVSYHIADVSQYQDFHQLVIQLEGLYGKIDGVVHLAGNTAPEDFTAVAAMDRGAALRHFSPKITGLLQLYNIFRHRQPDFVWIASSLSAVLGGLTYGAYAAANAFMDQFVAAHKYELPNWMTVNLDAFAFTASGEGIGRNELATVFESTLRMLVYPGIVVSVTDLRARIDKYVLKQQVASPAVKPAPIKERPVMDLEELTPVERQLLPLWADFFGLPSIHIEDDFFELGGDSLKAMTLAGKIHHLFGVQLPVQTIFAHPSIRALSLELSVITGMQQIQTVKHGSKNLKELTI